MQGRPSSPARHTRQRRRMPEPEVDAGKVILYTALATVLAFLLIRPFIWGPVYSDRSAPVAEIESPNP